MSVCTRSTREEDTRVFPTEVFPVAPARSSLDDPSRRCAALARGPSAGESLGLDRRGYCNRAGRPHHSLVATGSPRGLVRGGRR